MSARRTARSEPGPVSLLVRLVLAAAPVAAAILMVASWLAFGGVFGGAVPPSRLERDGPAGGGAGDGEGSGWKIVDLRHCIPEPNAQVVLTERGAWTTCTSGDGPDAWAFLAVYDGRATIIPGPEGDLWLSLGFAIGPDLDLAGVYRGGGGPLKLAVVSTDGAVRGPFDLPDTDRNTRLLGLDWLDACVVGAVENSGLGSRNYPTVTAFSLCPGGEIETRALPDATRDYPGNPYAAVLDPATRDWWLVVDDSQAGELVAVDEHGQQRRLGEYFTTGGTGEELDYSAFGLTAWGSSHQGGRVSSHLTFTPVATPIGWPDPDGGRGGVAEVQLIAGGDELRRRNVWQGQGWYWQELPNGTLGLRANRSRRELLARWASTEGEPHVVAALDVECPDLDRPMIFPGDEGGYRLVSQSTCFIGLDKSLERTDVAWSRLATAAFASPPGALGVGWLLIGAPLLWLAGWAATRGGSRRGRRRFALRVTSALYLAVGLPILFVLL